MKKNFLKKLFVVSIVVIGLFSVLNAAQAVTNNDGCYAIGGNCGNYKNKLNPNGNDFFGAIVNYRCTGGESNVCGIPYSLSNPTLNVPTNPDQGTINVSTTINLTNTDKFYDPNDLIKEGTFTFNVYNGSNISGQSEYSKTITKTVNSKSITAQTTLSVTAGTKTVVCTYKNLKVNYYSPSRNENRPFYKSGNCGTKTITVKGNISSCSVTSWSPITSTVCSGTSFTQTSNCGTTRVLGGTKNCTPSCTIVSWTPSPSTVCSGISFTQTNNCGNTRVSLGTKDCTPVEINCNQYDQWVYTGLTRYEDYGYCQQILQKQKVFYDYYQSGNSCSLNKTQYEWENTSTIISKPNCNNQYCGDGTCNNGETQYSCPQDCVSENRCYLNGSYVSDGYCNGNNICRLGNWTSHYNDGVINCGEECDSYNLNGKTCYSFGYNSGTLSCSYGTYNTSNCYNNNIINHECNFTGSRCQNNGTVETCSDIDNDGIREYRTTSCVANTGISYRSCIDDNTCKGTYTQSSCSAGVCVATVVQTTSKECTNGQCCLSGGCVYEGYWSAANVCKNGRWTPHCGDGTCNYGENYLSCASDCSQPVNPVIPTTIYLSNLINTKEIDSCSYQITPIKLSWVSNGEQAYYQLQISNNSNFTDILVDTGKFKSTNQSYTFNPGITGLNYWRVRVWNTSGSLSSWTNGNNFNSEIYANYDSNCKRSILYYIIPETVKTNKGSKDYEPLPGINVSQSSNDIVRMLFTVENTGDFTNRPVKLKTEIYDDDNPTLLSTSLSEETYIFSNNEKKNLSPVIYSGGQAEGRYLVNISVVDASNTDDKLSNVVAAKYTVGAQMTASLLDILGNNIGWILGAGFLLFLFLVFAYRKKG